MNDNSNNQPPVTEPVRVDLPADSLALIDERQVIDRARDSIANMTTRSIGLVIANDQGANDVTADVVHARKTIKALEKQQKELTKPHTDTAALIRTPFKILIEELQRLDGILAPKVARYHDEVEKKRLAAEAEEKRVELERLKAKLKEEEEQAELNESEHAIDDAIDTAEQIKVVERAEPSKAASVVRSHGGLGATAHRRKKLVIKVVDGEKIPKKYLVRKVETAAVKLAWSRGTRDFPGLEVYEESILATRTSRG